MAARRLAHWLNWYSTTYGAFVIALFFWIILEATIIVLAAALSPGSRTGATRFGQI